MVLGFPIETSNPRKYPSILIHTIISPSSVLIFRSSYLRTVALAKTRRYQKTHSTQSNLQQPHKPDTSQNYHGPPRVRLDLIQDTNKWPETEAQGSLDKRVFLRADHHRSCPHHLIERRCCITSTWFVATQLLVVKEDGLLTSCSSLYHRS